MAATAQSPIAVIGIDIGKNSFHVGWARWSWRNRASAEVVAWSGRKHARAPIKGRIH